MQNRPSQLAQAVAATRAHPHAAKIAEVAAEVSAQMADARTRHAAAADIEQVARRVGLERGDAESDFGNVLAILERGAEDPAERAIVAAFVAAGAVRAVEADALAARKWAERLCFVSAHVGFDPLAAMPEGVPPSVVRPLLRALAEHVRQIDGGKAPNADRGELIVACATLADAVDLYGDADIAQLTSRLAADIADPLGVRILTSRASDAPSTVVQSEAAIGALRGQLAPPPRHIAWTIVLALTGWLLLRSIGVLVGRLLLGLKRDARIALTERGLEVRAKTELLGRRLRVVDVVFPMSGLTAVARDVRFPSLHVYVGLAALLAGTYAGFASIFWGAQAASPRLLGYGVLALLTGVAIDLLLTSVLPGARGRCRMVIVPKRGPELCVAEVDAKEADRLLIDLARRLE